MQYDETKHHVKFQLHWSRHPGVNRKNNLKIMENCVKTALKPVNQLHESRTRRSNRFPNTNSLTTTGAK